MLLCVHLSVDSKILVVVITICVRVCQYSPETYFKRDREGEELVPVSVGQDVIDSRECVEANMSLGEVFFGCVWQCALCVRVRAKKMKEEQRWGRTGNRTRDLSHPKRESYH